MKVYLVRRIEDKGVLGVFWGSPEAVWDCVDELGDPPFFEAAELTFGAIYIDTPTEPVWQQYSDMEEEGPDYGPEDFAGYTPNETFFSAIRDQASLKWKRLDYADEGVGLLRRIFDTRKDK